MRVCQIQSIFTARFMQLLACLIGLSLSACSTTTRLAIGQISPVVYEGSESLQKEKNWSFFRASAPSSLQLAEMMVEKDPGNEELLALLVKGYASYAYVISDTLALSYRLDGEDDSDFHQQARVSLAKALSYGMRFMEEAGVSYNDIKKAANENKTSVLLEKHFDLDETIDKEALFFTGIAWLQSINYNMSQMLLTSQAGQAFSLIDSVCKKDPDFQNGMCPTLRGVYYLSRPRMLGGNPSQGRKLLREAMVTYPDNYMIPVTLIEWYLVPAGEKKAYHKLRNDVLTKLKVWRKATFIPGENRDTKSQLRKDLLNLINAMAEKRLSIIMSKESDLF